MFLRRTVLAAKATPGNRRRPTSRQAAPGEAKVVAVVNGGAWQAASVAGKEVVARLARRGAVYQLFPAGAAEGSGTSTVKGTLAGKVREECADFFVELAAYSTAQGFAVVNTPDEGDVVLAVPLQGAKIEQRDVVAVATVIERGAKIKIKPRIERAYHVDLDGNGKPETVLQQRTRIFWVILRRTSANTIPWSS